MKKLLGLLVIVVGVLFASVVWSEPIKAVCTWDAPISSVTEVVVDNGKADTLFVGNWQVSDGPGFYGSNSLYSKTAGATYSFDAALHGTHKVSLWWTEWPSRSTSVPVEIYDGDTLLDTVLVNQTAQGGQWNVLGTYNFAETARVTIISENSSYSTCADAVKFASMEARIDGYRIYIGDIQGGPYPTKLYDGNATVLEANIELDGECFLIARAYNGSGESEDSNEVHWYGFLNPPSPYNLQISVDVNATLIFGK